MGPVKSAILRFGRGDMPPLLEGHVEGPGHEIAGVPGGEAPGVFMERG